MKIRIVQNSFGTFDKEMFAVSANKWICLYTFDTIEAANADIDSMIRYKQNTVEHKVIREVSFD